MSYPKNWKEIATRIKDQAEWKCERCKHPHSVEGYYILTVHHLDGVKSNCADWNLAALCQRCHLTIQGRVKMDQLFFIEILTVSEWFKPHLKGYLESLCNTESKSDATLPPIGPCSETPRGLGRDGNKPLMRNRTGQKVAIPDSKTGGNTFKGGSR